MGETISSLKQDKELLQQELTKKAELICDFLQEQLRPGDYLKNNNFIWYEERHGDQYVGCDLDKNGLVFSDWQIKGGHFRQVKWRQAARIR